MTIEDRVSQALRTDPRVTDIRLVGSRKGGRIVPLSDWDFEVDAIDVEEVAQALPRLLAPLGPVYQFWDPLTKGPPWNYIVMLPGPVVLDLHFQREHQPEAPWRVNASTLQDIDAHFWDWAMYMAKKQTKGEHLLVEAELRKMYWFLLSPMGVDEQPTSIEEAITSYVSKRSEREVELGLRLSRDVQHESAKALRTAHIQIQGG